MAYEKKRRALVRFAAAITAAAFACSGEETQDSGSGADAGPDGPTNVLVDELTDTCMSRQISVDAAGSIACALIEAAPVTDTCRCEASAGRRTPAPAIAEAVLNRLVQAGACGSVSACDEFCVCEIVQLEGSRLVECQTSDQPASDLAGFCYIDASQDAGASALIAGCASQRGFRLVGIATMAGARLMLGCSGTSF